jgi:hypothetical protein
MTLQNLHYKIHRSDRVVMNDDAIERLEFRLSLFDDLNFGQDGQSHFYIRFFCGVWIYSFEQVMPTRLMSCIQLL